MQDFIDARLFRRSAAALEPYFADLAREGARGAAMPALRRIGLDAEAAMRAAPVTLGRPKIPTGDVFARGQAAVASSRPSSAAASSV